VPVDGLGASFAAAADALAGAVDRSGPLDAVVVALTGTRSASGAAAAWEQVLAEHADIVEGIHADAGWARAVADYATAADRPVRLVQLLEERSVSLVEVPHDEFDSMGPNVLALAPRVALAIEGNPETRRRMEAAGVEVRTYTGNEISRKGDGGPTCLTRPLLRS